MGHKGKKKEKKRGRRAKEEGTKGAGVVEDGVASEVREAPPRSSSASGKRCRSVATDVEQQDTKMATKKSKKKATKKTTRKSKKKAKKERKPKRKKVKAPVSTLGAPATVDGWTLTEGAALPSDVGPIPYTVTGRADLPAAVAAEHEGEEGQEGQDSGDDDGASEGGQEGSAEVQEEGGDNDDDEAVVGKKRKKRPKKKKKKKLQQKATKPQVAEEHAANVGAPGSAQEAAMAYLRTWAEDKEQWKFKKVRQTYLLRHMYAADRVPDDMMDTLCDYLQGLKGAVRQATLDLARKYVEEREPLFGADASMSMSNVVESDDESAEEGKAEADGDGDDDGDEAEDVDEDEEEVKRLRAVRRQERTRYHRALLIARALA